MEQKIRIKASPYRMLPVGTIGSVAPYRKVVCDLQGEAPGHDDGCDCQDLYIFQPDNRPGVSYMMRARELEEVQ